VNTSVDCSAIYTFVLHNVVEYREYLFLKYYQVIAPLSASGVVLDAPESSKLLSAVAIALSNCVIYLLMVFIEAYPISKFL